MTTPQTAPRPSPGAPKEGNNPRTLDNNPDCLQQGRIRDAYNVTASTYVDEDGVAVEKPEWPPLLVIKNLIAKATSEVRPWDFVPSVPEFESNEEYLKWRKTDSTDHLCYSGTVGYNKSVRQNKKTNAVSKIRALIANYDSKITVAMEEAVLKNAPADLRPNWIHTTHSGGRRLVWLFDESVPFDDTIAKRFFEVAGNELHTTSLLPGLDEPAWADPYRFYDVGTDWRQLSDNLLSSSVIHLWLVEAGKKTDWSKVSELQIPFDDVAEEVQKKFGNVLEGTFELGQRTNRFWTPDIGDNPTASIVTERGMISFSGDQLFTPWSKILGAAFCRKYQAEKIASATQNVWYVGDKYYRKLKGVWQPEIKSDFTEHLIHNCKMKAEDAMGARLFVRERQRLDGVIPCLFDERDTVTVNGKQFLNNARVKPVQPHEEPQTWATNFPWIARFLQLRFDDVERPYFLGWWKRFYCSALAGDLLKGHALFIVGKVKLGKTLLGVKMLGASVGGCVDASKYATGSEFNKEACEVALRCIDDGEVASDPNSHRRFSERVKAMVANPQENYRAMYRDAQTVQWNGRLLVTLNDDAQSLQMIPDLATSMEEKVMVLRFQDTPYEFPPKHILESTIEAELPAFLRWLVDWSMPDEVMGDNRLGVKSHINEELRLMALNASASGNLSELVDLWIERSKGAFEGDYWIGTTTKFFAEMMSDDVLYRSLGKQSTRSLGKRFAEAAEIKDSGIEVEKNSKNGNTWKIRVKRKTQTQTRKRKGKG